MILFTMRAACWLANWTKAVQTLIKGWNRSINFEVEGLDSFHLKVKEGAVFFYKGPHGKPDLVIKSTKKNFRGMLRGDFQFEEGFVRKKFDAMGPVRDAAKFKRMMGLIIESHPWFFSMFRMVFGRFL